MTSVAVSPASQLPSIPLNELLPWAIFGGLMRLLALYFVGIEEGATSIFFWHV
jgi:hypothetical protein